MAEAHDERDRRRAIWIWPSLFVLGFWVPLFIRLSPERPPGSLSRGHAAKALRLFFGYWAAILLGLALAISVGHPAPAVIVIGGATALFVSLAAAGFMSAIGSSVPLRSTEPARGPSTGR